MARAFVIKKAINQQFYFILRDDNNEPILRASETYPAKDNCKKGIGSVRANAPNDGNYTRFNDVQGKPTFNLKAGNGETIGVAESYNSTQARENGIASVKQCAPNAPEIDET
jgi:uncharacterized protein YegP (UPF0339 family)